MAKKRSKRRTTKAKAKARRKRKPQPVTGRGSKAWVKRRSARPGSPTSKRKRTPAIAKPLEFSPVGGWHIECHKPTIITPANTMPTEDKHKALYAAAMRLVGTLVRKDKQLTNEECGLVVACAEFMSIDKPFAMAA